MEAQLVEHHQESANLAHDQQPQQFPPVPHGLTQAEWNIALVAMGSNVASQQSYALDFSTDLPPPPLS